MKNRQNQTNYRPGSRNYASRPSPQKNQKKRFPIKAFIVLLILAIVVALSVATANSGTTKTQSVNQTTSKTQSVTKYTPSTAAKTAPTEVAKTNMCANNSLSQLIVVSISQQHLWACNQSSVLYDSAVVTGNMNLPADLTPVGTYHVYAKETNIWLNGSDSTGSWHDFFYYWMPFLYNQYGAYGFHDATWRPSNAFGNISPYSNNASHGCVECPLAAAAWLYNWSVIGTTVTVES